MRSYNPDPRNMGYSVDTFWSADTLKETAGYLDTGAIKKSGMNAVVSLADKFGLGDMFKSPAKPDGSPDNTKIYLIAGGVTLGIIVLAMVMKKK